MDSKKIKDPLEFLDFFFLGSDMNITITRCNDLSLLFLNAACSIAMCLGCPSKVQNFNSIESAYMVCSGPYNHLLWDLLLQKHPEKIGKMLEIVFLTATSLCFQVMKDMQYA